MYVTVLYNGLTSKLLTSLAKRELFKISGSSLLFNSLSSYTSLAFGYGLEDAPPSDGLTSIGSDDGWTAKAS